MSVTDNFTQKHFQLYSRYIYDQFGMHMNEQKQSLLFLKVEKAMKKFGIDSYDAYFQILTNPANQSEIRAFASIITTNTTEFFREKDHFLFLRNKLEYISAHNPRIEKNREIRIWSAGCSTGQEPYTLAMVAGEIWGERFDVKILATDLSSKVLRVAAEGLYDETISRQIPKAYLAKYFDPVDAGYQVRPEIQKKITFRHFNLMAPFPFRKGFDIIFCRNVMIYFDTPTQQELVGKFYGSLVKGGLLFVGHSESLMNKEHNFKYVEPAIYIKQ